MDTYELFDYAVKVMSWVPTVGVATYIGVMLSNPISMRFSKKISTQKELDDIIALESKKLKLTGVKGILSNENQGCAYYSDDIPTIEVGGLGANRSGVRHELYHIYRKDIDDEVTMNMKYFFLQEPRACLYQSTGIKL